MYFCFCRCLQPRAFAAIIPEIQWDHAGAHRNGSGRADSLQVTTARYSNFLGERNYRAGAAHRFMDEQRRRPSRLWKHGHRFTEQAGGTEVVDPVHYAVCGGSLVNLFVAPDERGISTMAAAS
jgi:hypothetical protein